MDAAYQSIQSKKWESIEIEGWRGATGSDATVTLADYDADHLLIKEEKMPDGSKKVILKNKTTGQIMHRIVTE